MNPEGTDPHTRVHQNVGLASLCLHYIHVTWIYTISTAELFLHHVPKCHPRSSLALLHSQVWVKRCCSLGSLFCLQWTAAVRLRRSTGSSSLCSFIEHEGNRDSFQVPVLGRLSEISVSPRHKTKMVFFLHIIGILMGQKKCTWGCMLDAISKWNLTNVAKGQEAKEKEKSPRQSSTWERLAELVHGRPKCKRYLSLYPKQLVNVVTNSFSLNDWLPCLGGGGFGSPAAVHLGWLSLTSHTVCPFFEVLNYSYVLAMLQT